jgi:antitoxin ParD1/3/4
MNVELTPDLERMVDSKVKTGRYDSATEVIREALRLMDERDQSDLVQKEELREKIAAGLRSLSEGRAVDGEDYFTQIEAELDEEIRAEDERNATQAVSGQL